MKLYLYDNTRPGASEEMFRRAAYDYCRAAIGACDCGGSRSGPDGGDEIFSVARGPHGKPYFAKPPLRGRVHFSLSHSGAYGALLFHGETVGLDIEDLSLRGALEAGRMERIAARFFTEDERKYVIEGEAPGLRQRFFGVWTAKEAYIKYTGRGMSEGLSSFSSLDPPGGVTITTFLPEPGLICSRCARGEHDFGIARPDRGDDYHKERERQGGSASPSATQ
jgi:hypothetical protein